MLVAASLPPNKSGPWVIHQPFESSALHLLCCASAYMLLTAAKVLRPLSRLPVSSAFSCQTLMSFLLCTMCDSRQQFRFDHVMQLIRDVMTKGKEAGLNVIRAWATSASPHYALQTSPGNFSEAIFRGLDYALDQARQLDLKVSNPVVPFRSSFRQNMCRTHLPLLTGSRPIPLSCHGMTAALCCF